MKNLEQRLNNIIGQLEGVKKMVNTNKQCEDIIIQLKASKSGINSVMDKIIEESSIKCLSGCGKKNVERVKNLIKEIIKNN